MYKDKDKQREATKEATRRYRAKNEDSALSGQKRVSQNARGLPVLAVVSDTLPVIPKTKALPACVPEPVSSRYAKGEPEYTQTIDRLLSHTIDQLKALSVWIPVWRYTAGQTIA